MIEKQANCTFLEMKVDLTIPLKDAFLLKTLRNSRYLDTKIQSTEIL